MIQPDDEIGQDGQGCIASPVAVPDYVDAVPIHGRAAAVVNSIAENHLRRQVARAKSAHQHCQEKDSLHCSCLPSPPREESVTKSGLTSVPAHASEQNSSRFPVRKDRELEAIKSSKVPQFFFTFLIKPDKNRGPVPGAQSHPKPKNAIITHQHPQILPGLPSWRHAPNWFTSLDGSVWT